MSSGRRSFRDTAQAVWDNFNASHRLELLDEGLNGRSFLQAFLDDVGYGTPTVMDDADFDALYREMVVNRERPVLMYRGMGDSDTHSGADMLDDMLYSDRPYVGEGIYGDGYYFSQEPGTAYTYATMKGSGGSVAQAMLKPGTRVFEVEQGDWDYMTASMKEAGISDTSYAEGIFSAHLRAQGYGAIKVDRGSDSYYSVIDRDAIIAKRSYTDVGR